MKAQGLDHLVPFTEVLDAELGVGSAAVVVLDDRIADVDRIACLYMVEERGHIEGYGGDMVVRVRFLDEFELEMASFSTYLASHSVVIYVFGKEYRGAVSRAERLELLQYAQELRRDLREIQDGVDVHHRCLHFRNDAAGYEFLYPFAEERKVFLLQGEAGGIEVASEILKQVRTVFYGIIKIEPMHASCRTGYESALRLREDYRRLVEGFNEP